MKYRTGPFKVIKKKEKASMTFSLLLLKFQYPLELLVPSLSRLQYLLNATNIKLATDCNKFFCFLGLVGLYAGNW